MKEEIRDTILRAIPDASVRVESPDGEHFGAVVISATFEGMLLVKQHQMVMKALKDEFDSTRLHALQLKTYTPEKWAAAQQQSPLSVV